MWYARHQPGGVLLYVSRNGVYGVSMFFVISGFVITRSLLSRTPDLAKLDLRDFYTRRVARILPLFTTIVIFGAVMWAVLPDSPARHFCFHDREATYGFWFWASLPTMTFNWLRSAFGRMQFGMHWDVLWSLAIEEQFYLLYPPLLLWCKTIARARKALIAVVAFGPIARVAFLYLVPGNVSPARLNSFGCFEQIAVGALLAMYFHERGERQRSRSDRFALAVLGIFGIVGLTAVYAETSHIDVAWVPTSIEICLALALFAGMELGWLSSRAGTTITYPGQLSYGGYLLHSTVLYIGWTFFVTQEYWVSLSMYLVASFAVAAVSYHFFEEPLNKRIRRALKPRLAIDGVSG